MSTAVTLCCLLVYTALSAEPARVLVTVEHGRVRFAPADIRLRVTVEPHAQNRHLLVEADGPAFYRSSYEALTGESPRTRWVNWRAAPEGEYDIRATVIDVRGKAHTAHDTLTVRGWEGL